jgi:hypothetical protein
MPRTIAPAAFTRERTLTVLASRVATGLAVLAIVQAVLGVLRALQWVRLGSDLVERGLLIVPVLGYVAMARGLLVGAIAILYLAFAWAVLTRRPWASPAGVAAALLNGLVIVTALLAGGSVMAALVWAIVPVALLVYLCSPAAKHLRGDRRAA